MKPWSTTHPPVDSEGRKCPSIPMIRETGSARQWASSGRRSDKCHPSQRERAAGGRNVKTSDEKIAMKSSTCSRRTGAGQAADDCYVFQNTEGLRVLS